MYQELGQSSDLEVLLQLVAIESRRVMDIGCGDGAFAAAMAARGARVIGVEPNPVQAEKNRTRVTDPGLDLIEAGAEALPVAAGSQDLLVFRFSLHHIPAGLYPRVFEEAARVLRTGGQLYVIEPLAEDSSQYVMELFHDETLVRAKAQSALRELTPTWFSAPAGYRYEVRREYDSFDAYVRRYGNMSYNDYARHQVEDIEVRRRFEEFTGADGRTELVQPVRVDLFTRLPKGL